MERWQSDKKNLSFWLREASESDGVWGEFPLITPQGERNGLGSILKVAGISDKELMEISASVPSMECCIQILFDGIDDVFPKDLLGSLSHALMSSPKSELLSRYGHVKIHQEAIDSWVDVLRQDYLNNKGI